MLNRKLLEILNLFKPADHTQLRLFLQSPYFNANSDASELLRLYDYIMTAHAQEEHPDLEKSKVAAIFFPQKQYNEKQKGPLDALTSNLFKLVKRFLAQRDFDRKNLDFEEGLTLAKYYRGFGMEDRYWQVLQALRKEYAQVKTQDAIYFRQHFQIEEEAATFQSLNNSFEDDVNIAVAVKHLDIAYLLEKIELICSLKYQEKLAQPISFNFDTPLAKVVLEYPADYPPNPLYDLQYLALQLIENPLDDELFSQYESSLLQFEPVLPFDKLRNLKAYLRYFLIQRYSKIGGAIVREKVFEVYKRHFEQGYFYENGQIMINSLKALILFGLRLKQFDWVKSVLDAHPPDMICGTKYPMEAFNLCQAEYYFYLKEYALSNDTLLYKPFENPNFSLWADMLLVKIYFETEDELLEYRMKSLDQKVRRTKISQEQKSNYYRFLQKLDKILKYRSEKKSQKWEKLISEIKDTPGIHERDWLLEKIGVVS